MCNFAHKPFNTKRLNHLAMKKIIFALTCIAAATAAVSSRTVTNPDFVYAPINFSITEAQLSDTSTRLRADIYQRPGYWVTVDTNIYLKGAATGKTYPLTTAEGVPMRQKITMSDSAYTSAVFVFPPLAPEDTVVDFIEKGGSWNILKLNLGSHRPGFATRVSGTLNGRPEASWLLLAPGGDDDRVNKAYIVPVRNGAFDYTLYTTDTLFYELYPGIDRLKGGWSNYRFFAEGEPVVVDIPAGDEFQLHSPVKGGRLTTAYNTVTDSIRNVVIMSGIIQLEDSLSSARAKYTPEVYAIMDSLDANPKMAAENRKALIKKLDELRANGGYYSEAGEKFREFSDSISTLPVAIKRDFIGRDSSLVGLYMIYDAMKYKQPELDDYMPLFVKNYAEKFAGHPYAQSLSAFIGEEAALPGRKVPDFTAPDLDGNSHTLSQLIAGKIALVDLWASWCGPCRLHSMAMIPVYDKWKDRGFTVVAIARENGGTDDMKAAIARDGYTWLNLVELNDAGKIWEKYRAGNSGGKQVLVGADGKVIAIDPTPAEVEAILARSL